MPARDHNPESTIWGQPKPCRHCANLVASSATNCPNCLGPTRLFCWSSAHTGLLWLQGVGENLLAGVLTCLLLSAALATAYFLSPLLLLFPLLLVGSPPPASRGGKTVARGKRRSVCK